MVRMIPRAANEAQPVSSLNLVSISTLHANRTNKTYTLCDVTALQTRTLEVINLIEICAKIDSL